MGKIHLVSWRRKDRIRGEIETAAQRRARERENGERTCWPLTSISAVIGNKETAVPAIPQAYGWDMLTTVADTSPEVTDDDLEGIVIPDILGGMRRTRTPNGKPPEYSRSSTVHVELNLAQSQTLRASPLTGQVLSARTSSLRCQLKELPHRGTVMLKLAKQPETTLNVMSLKDVSEKLCLGRKAIMRLVQDGILRHQRLANRHVFAAEDVSTYRTQRLAAQTLTRE